MTTDEKELQTMPEGVDFSVNEAEMKAQKATNVTPSYIEFKKGEPVFCKFVGFTTISLADKKSGEIRALKTVVLSTAKGFVINSGVNLVNQCERSNFKAGTALKIELTDTADKTKIYTIYLLS